MLTECMLPFKISLQNILLQSTADDKTRKTYNFTNTSNTWIPLLLIKIKSNYFHISVSTLGFLQGD